MKHILILERNLNDLIGLMELLNQKGIFAFDVFPHLKDMQRNAKKAFIMDTIEELREHDKADLLLIDPLLSRIEDTNGISWYHPPVTNLLLGVEIANEVIKKYRGRIKVAFMVHGGTSCYTRFESEHLDNFLKCNGVNSDWPLIQYPSSLECSQEDFQSKCPFNSKENNCRGSFKKCYPATIFNRNIRVALDKV